jgi:hypothetical protein
MKIGTLVVLSIYFAIVSTNPKLETTTLKYRDFMTVGYSYDWIFTQRRICSREEWESFQIVTLTYYRKKHSDQPAFQGGRNFEDVFGNDSDKTVFYVVNRNSTLTKWVSQPWVYKKAKDHLYRIEPNDPIIPLDTDYREKPKGYEGVLDDDEHYLRNQITNVKWVIRLNAPKESKALCEWYLVITPESISTWKSKRNMNKYERVKKFTNMKPWHLLGCLRDERQSTTTKETITISSPTLKSDVNEDSVGDGLLTTTYDPSNERETKTNEHPVNEYFPKLNPLSTSDHNDIETQSQVNTSNDSHHGVTIFFMILVLLLFITYFGIRLHTPCLTSVSQSNDVSLFLTNLKKRSPISRV